MTALVRSELMKIRTTNVWWLFSIGVLVFTFIMVAVWLAVGSEELAQAAGGTIPPPPDQSLEPSGRPEPRDLERVLRNTASQVYTSGQFFGVMFAMLLGAILVTNEFHHQTATTTFLTTPKRTKVIVAKLITAASAAVFFWLLTTLVGVIAGAIFFSLKGYPVQLTEWQVVRAMLMNGLAYGLWGVLGVGLGVLIRNQIGAVVTGAVAYIIGTQAVQVIFFLVYEYLVKKDWVLTAMVAWPSMASQVMVSPEKIYPQSPAWWVGALVLIGYGVLFGTIGTLITRKRDIS